MDDLDEHKLGMVTGAAKVLSVGGDYETPARVLFIKKANSLLNFCWRNEEENKEIPLKILAPRETWDTAFTGKGR